MMMQPEIFHVGSLSIRWYGAMVASGLVAAFLLCLRRRQKYSFTPDQVSDMFFWLMAGAIVGARGLYVIRFWNEEFAEHPAEILKIWNGGLVFLGGFAGAFVVMLVMSSLRKCSPWKIADFLAPALLLGQAFGRIGCLVNGCCHGFAYDGIFACSYPMHPAGTFPLQALSSFAALCGCLLLLWLEWRKLPQGLLAVGYFVLYCVGRFGLEFMRGDYPAHQLWHGLTPAQVSCLWMLPVALLCFGVWRYCAGKAAFRTKTKRPHSQK